MHTHILEPSFSDSLAVPTLFNIQTSLVGLQARILKSTDQPAVGGNLAHQDRVTARQGAFAWTDDEEKCSGCDRLPQCN